MVEGLGLDYGVVMAILDLQNYFQIIIIFAFRHSFKRRGTVL